jgi:hypothetical protein
MKIARTLMTLPCALALTTVCAALLSVSAQQVKERLATPAGEIRITQLDEGELGNQFAVTLGDRSILQTNGEEDGQFSDSPVPTILKHFNAVTPYDEVVVFQQNMWGNACDGGPLWFLGLKRDGTFSVSLPIDFCGGRQPVLKQTAGRIIITLPGGPPNRGSGYIPTETWVYENGRVRQLKPPKKFRK